ncbi:MAG TPA: hypothetical protein VKK31_17430 [Thermoanaerobaculia bacterium]|nr:hypothetical protein [Thermoanaerobaculia bacterium]
MRWRWCLAAGALALVPLATRAGTQPPEENAAGGWERYEEEGGCIGGSRCGDQGDEIRIPLENAAVEAVRFHAHDDVGETSEGRLRVRIDAAAVAPDIDVAKEGQVYELPAAGRRGRFLVIEARTDDEVVVEDVEIQYRGLQAPRERREWRAYPEEAGCIGGERCRDQGNVIRIRLEDAPVYGVRFHAHDKVGEHTRGHLGVRIDSRRLAKDIDVPRVGQIYSLQVEGARGRYLIFEVLTAEEVVVEQIEVQYSGLGDPWEKRRPSPPSK